MTQRIQYPFAYQGDKKVVPVSDANGFVNLTQGYTPDYEIDLDSNNPRAKAVERPIQNFLFNMITENLQFWQQRGYPEWFSTMSGGYSLNALVVRQTGAGVWQPYRSLVNSNISDPLTNPAQWAYVKTPAEALRDIPMPSGGTGGSGAELITTARDFNAETVANGTFEVSTDAVAALCTNLPAASGGAAKKAGMLEDKRWGTVGNANRTGVQRYLNADGVLFVRALRSTTWSTWAQIDSNAFFRAGGMRDYSSNSTIAVDGVGYFHRWLGGAGTLTLQARSTVTGIQGQYVVNNGSGICTLAAASGDQIRIGTQAVGSIALQPGDCAFLMSTSSATQWEVIDGSIILYYSQTLMNYIRAAGTSGGDTIQALNGNIVAVNGLVKAQNSSQGTGTLFADGNTQGTRWAIHDNPNNYAATYVDIKVQDALNQVYANFVQNVRWGGESEIVQVNFADYGAKGRITTVPSGGVIVNLIDANSSGNAYLEDIDAVRWRFLQKNINGTWFTVGT